MNYESWRITFQDSEQAARAAFKATEDMHKDALKIEAERDALQAHAEELAAALDAVCKEIEDEYGEPLPPYISGPFLVYGIARAALAKHESFTLRTLWRTDNGTTNPL